MKSLLTIKSSNFQAHIKARIPKDFFDDYDCVIAIDDGVDMGKIDVSFDVAEHDGVTRLTIEPFYQEATVATYSLNSQNNANAVENTAEALGG